jgi:hypothetical protein
MPATKMATTKLVCIIEITAIEGRIGNLRLNQAKTEKVDLKGPQNLA